MCSWNNITVEFDSIVHEKESLGASIILTIYEDIKLFHKSVSHIVDMLMKDTFSSNFDEVVENLKNIKIKTQTSNKDLMNLMNLHNSSLEDFIKKMKNLLIKSSVQINVIFTNYHLIKKNLLEIIEKMEKYSEGLTNLEKDFSYLSNPSYFPQAYQASIIEIKRRLIFNRKISKDFERLKQLIVKENLNRKQFIQDYGKYLTHDYVPQLKFSELKLSIDFSNQEEINCLPNILDDEEESQLNTNNIYLDYDDFISQGQDSLIRQNLGLEANSSSHRNGQNVVRSVSSTRKNSEENNNLKKNYEYEETIRSLNAKISELEIVNSIKEGEVKKILAKLEGRERKITIMQSELEKLSTTIENLSENFLKQLNYKDQKLKEKIIENENMTKALNSQNNNKLDNCPMCRDIVTNSIDYQGWGNFVKDYHEKLNEKNKVLSKLETRYQELVTQTTFIKKTFFTHLNSVVEAKNIEILNLKQHYENRLMTVEDFLSQERSRNDKQEFESKSLNQNQTQSIQGLENRIKDLSKLLNSYDCEIKNLKKEKENLKKLLDDFKLKESEYKNKNENLMNEFKILERQYDQEKKTINQMGEENFSKEKENSTLKLSLENQAKIIKDLEKEIENYKINHIETLNEIHKANQLSIEKLNIKIEDLSKEMQEKLSEYENVKILNESLKEKNEALSKLPNECDQLRNQVDNLFKTNEEIEIKNSSIKKKLNDLQIILIEKDKKIQEFNELTNFSSITNKNLESDNLNVNNINTICLDSDELINVKKLELGSRSIFVPHSPGVYVSVNLNSNQIESCNNENNTDSNYEINKFYKCNSILNIDIFDSELKELLM